MNLSFVACFWHGAAALCWLFLLVLSRQILAEFLDCWNFGVGISVVAVDIGQFLLLHSSQLFPKLI